MNKKTSSLARSVRLLIITFSFLLAQPALAISQEGTPDPGQGLTALETTLYFVLAPLGLFVTIVLVGYAVHRPRSSKINSTNVLTEIR